MRSLKQFPAQQHLDRLAFSQDCGGVLSIICIAQNYDEDELEAELDMLGEELEDEEALNLTEDLLRIGPAPAPRLPEAPRAEPVRGRSAKAKVEEDPDMAELSAWAN